MGDQHPGENQIPRIVNNPTEVLHPLWTIPTFSHQVIDELMNGNITVEMLIAQEDNKKKMDLL